jgi:hypothetical protein
MGTPKKRQRVRNFTSLAEYEAKKAKEGDLHVMEFDGYAIRAILHAGEWHFSVVDVVAALADTDRPRKYWADLKSRLEADEGFIELSAKIGQLKLPASDGKRYATDCADPETLFRIIQSIPSPKAEPFKRWFAHVAYEKLKEKARPSQAIEREIAKYRAMGRPEDWIDLRVQAISSRNDITDEWNNRRVASNRFGIITSQMSEVALGVTPKEHMAIKGLPEKANLRNEMTGSELVITAFAERAGTEIIRKRDTQGYAATKAASVDGAKVAAVARKALEEQLGTPVVSAARVLPEK